MIEYVLCTVEAEVQRTEMQHDCKEYVTDKQVEDDLMYNNLHDNVVVAKYELKENKNENIRVEMEKLGIKAEDLSTWIGDSSATVHIPHMPWAWCKIMVTS
jgi:hypothetical protein